MSQICQITGKHSRVGNTVSHSNRKAKRKFKPNLFNKKFFMEDEKRWIILKVSASGMRVINKIGLKAAMKKSKEKGYLHKI